MNLEDVTKIGRKLLELGEVVTELSEAYSSDDAELVMKYHNVAKGVSKLSSDVQTLGLYLIEEKRRERENPDES